MLGVHPLIGLGEAAITGLVVAASSRSAPTSCTAPAACSPARAVEIRTTVGGARVKGPHAGSSSLGLLVALLLVAVS